MEPISVRDRETIVKHKQEGKPGRKITKWLMIYQQTVSQICNNFNTGNVASKHKNSGRKPKITHNHEKIFTKIGQQPNIVLNALINHSPYRK